MRRLILASACALLLNACQQQAAEAPPAAAVPAKPAAEPAHVFVPEISAGDFIAHVKTLASDEFGGRKPGSKGEELTIAYLKQQFERLGLKPGNGDSFFQDVPMTETVLLDPDKVALHVKTDAGEENFAYRSDAIVGTLQGIPDATVSDSDIVFVGYGVIAPEYQWNDYAGLDVKGKTVIVLVNDPGWGNKDPALFKGPTMTYYGRWTYKYEEAARQGAAAALIVHDTDAAAYPWEVVVNSWSGPHLALPASVDADPRLPIAGWLTTPSAQRLFSKAGLNFDELKRSADLRGFKASALKAKLSVSLKSNIRNTTSKNVLALLPGSTHPDEAIVYTAHWDHLGTSFTGTDRVYNGAIDNATGVAGLLEIAETFAHQEPKPERSVLFAAVTLEESGLLGSQYLAAHPTIPLNKTVANINMDALPVMGRSHNFTVVGFGNSEMDQYLKDAAGAQNRVVVGEYEPEKGYFYRSDQLNFAKKGVPVLYAHAGFDLVDGGEAAGRAAAEDYTRNRYHKPSDEYAPNWDVSGTIEDLQAFYAIGRRLSSETTWPQWNADSEFRAAREESMKNAAPTPTAKH